MPLLGDFRLNAERAAATAGGAGIRIGKRKATRI